MATAVTEAKDPNPSQEKKEADSSHTDDPSVVLSETPVLSSSSVAPADFEVKHPLQDAWTWWFDNPKKKSTQQSWGANLKKIYSFATVEDFWSLWNNVKGAHELAPGSDYHVFKDAIQPMWEDTHNRNGGKWVLVLKNNQRKTLLNQAWLSGLLACIGATFDDDAQITGIVVSLRKSLDKIALWTSDASDDVAVKRIGEQFKGFLNPPPSVKLQYMSHLDAMDNNSSYNNKPRFEI